MNAMPTPDFSSPPDFPTPAPSQPSREELYNKSLALENRQKSQRKWLMTLSVINLIAIPALIVHAAWMHSILVVWSLPPIPAWTDTAIVTCVGGIVLMVILAKRNQLFPPGQRLSRFKDFGVLGLIVWLAWSKLPGSNMHRWVTVELALIVYILATSRRRKST